MELPMIADEELREGGPGGGHQERLRPLAADYLETSPWVACPADVQPPLEADIAADVAIVGAGYTGLSTALALKRAGVDVAVLERDWAGFGASGRNAGHLTPTIGKDLPTLLMMFGKERAARLVRFADEAVCAAEHFMREHHIDCDYLPCGNVMAAVHPKQEARLRKAAAVAAQLGARVRFLTREDLRARGVPSSFVAGVLEDAGGILDPGKYVMGMRAAAVAAGVRLYEHTAVRELVDGPRPRVRTVAGSVTADALVLATNAYTPALGRLRHTLYPLYDTLFETEPLTVTQLGALGWNGKEGIYTAHESLESYRLTARATILGGSKGVRYAYGSALVGGPYRPTLTLLERAFRDRFPELNDVMIAHFWGGWIAMTLHFLPAIGRIGKNVHYGLGYNGHGVAAATAMGPMLADVVLGRRNEHAEIFRRFVPPLPPEPLRWLVIRGLMRVINQIDARVDWHVRASRRSAT
jgi:glycine/D-amino acid oxidase-like deaminating enzyme